MACNLLPTSLSHRFCYKDETKGWILIKTSVHGSSKCAGCAFDKASFAARSASSFPVISLWLGLQQNVMNLPLDNISWHVCKTLFTRGFLLSWLSMACNTDILDLGGIVVLMAASENWAASLNLILPTKGDGYVSGSWKYRRTRNKAHRIPGAAQNVRKCRRNVTGMETVRQVGKSM